MSAALSVAVVLGFSSGSAAADSWFSGDWYLQVGAAGFRAPKFEGAKGHIFSASPLISLGRAGSQVRFTSRNDNMSFSLLDVGTLRAGPVGKIVWGRSSGDAELKGLDSVKWGAEAGVFAEVYPTDWLRIRGEVRRGFRSHSGVVTDVFVDAFQDVTPTVRISGGPRLQVGSAKYLDAYYGVTPAESARSGLRPYKSDTSLSAVGVGGEIKWRTTDAITTSAFGEYRRLMGSARDSSLVRQRGSANQLMLGVSATYRFDFTM
ncbi:MipA/OmpV family protein [Pseudaminobacter soli (ex Li et al. 2025)]|nr:MipA/OmpV family protein [Mesorhizobium soli]